MRYLASPTLNANGPHVSDPRSGEIIESDINWYHNVMKLLRNWYFIQTSAVDPDARSTEFKDELMGELIRFVSAHEVGHTIGLHIIWVVVVPFLLIHSGQQLSQKIWNCTLCYGLCTI